MRPVLTSRLADGGKQPGITGDRTASRGSYDITLLSGTAAVGNWLFAVGPHSGKTTSGLSCNHELRPLCCVLLLAGRVSVRSSVSDGVNGRLRTKP
jgi:hypothetical protein